MEDELMTIGNALYNFFSQFEIPAHPDTNVPENATYPYMTYQVREGEFGDGGQSITVQIWYKGSSEAIPTAKADEIKAAIGRGGVQLPVDDGSVWIRKGSPWCIHSCVQGNTSIKLRQLNITLDFNI